MNGQEPRTSREDMRARGYFIIRHWEAMPPLDEYEDLNDLVGASPRTLEGQGQLITSNGVILEDPPADGQWTKIEHLHGAGWFKEITAALQSFISDQMGEPYVLFKDKINNKRPGLGRFDWHQDFESYRLYVPTYHVTAMVSLTPSTKQNGCLRFAECYREVVGEEDAAARTGDNVLLRYSTEGPNRGNIEPALAARFETDAVETQPDDILLFDSFVPHCSSLNRATEDRPALFLTFNRLREGMWYSDYYEKKLRSR
jgi:2-aminoethylphosphonate dioxygenase